MEYDHQIPFSLGGKNSVSNIRHLCSSCNKREAINKLGQNVMDCYLGSTFPEKKREVINIEGKPVVFEQTPEGLQACLFG